MYRWSAAGLGRTAIVIPAQIRFGPAHACSCIPPMLMQAKAPRDRRRHSCACSSLCFRRGRLRPSTTLHPKMRETLAAPWPY
ncbi:hypothetical protein LX36DRAFT_234740 [Colletotrichum falcatum]|nr:hypothetical protein LX36DRAFT_234740 [Colletotrichum falcatum]